MTARKWLTDWWIVLTITVLFPLCEFSFPEGLGVLFLLAAAPLAAKKKLFGASPVVEIYSVAVAGLFIFVRGAKANSLPNLFLITIFILMAGLIYFAWDNSKKVFRNDRDGRLLGTTILLTLAGMTIGIIVWGIENGYWKLLGPVLASLIILAYLSPGVTGKNFNRKTYVLICFIALGRFGADIVYYNSVGQSPDRNASQIERYAWFKIPGAYKTVISQSDKSLEMGKNEQAANWAMAAFKLEPSRTETALRLAAVLEPGNENRKRLLKRVVREMPADQIKTHVSRILQLLSQSRYYSPIVRLLEKSENEPLNLSEGDCDPVLGSWLINLGQVEQGRKVLEKCREENPLPSYYDEYDENFEAISYKLKTMGEYPEVRKEFTVVNAPDSRMIAKNGKPVAIPFTIVPKMPMEGGLHLYARISRPQRLPKRVVLGARVKSETLLTAGEPTVVEVFLDLAGIKPGSHEFYIGAFDPADPDAEPVRVLWPDDKAADFFFLGTIDVR